MLQILFKRYAQAKESLTQDQEINNLKSKNIFFKKHCKWQQQKTNCILRVNDYQRSVLDTNTDVL